MKRILNNIVVTIPILMLVICMVILIEINKKDNSMEHATKLYLDEKLLEKHQRLIVLRKRHDNPKFVEKRTLAIFEVIDTEFERLKGCIYDFYTELNENKINMIKKEISSEKVEKAIVILREDEIKKREREADDNALTKLQKVEEKIESIKNNKNMKFGLKNGIGICYLNTVFLLLFNIPEFRSEMEVLKKRLPKDDIISGLCALFDNMKGNNLNGYNCSFRAQISDDLYIIQDECFLLALKKELSLKKLRLGCSFYIINQLFKYIEKKTKEAGYKDFIRHLFKTDLKRVGEESQKTKTSGLFLDNIGYYSTLSIGNHTDNSIKSQEVILNKTDIITNKDEEIVDVSKYILSYQNDISRLPPIYIIEIPLKNKKYKIDSNITIGDKRYVLYQMMTWVYSNPPHIFMSIKDPDSDSWVEFDDFTVKGFKKFGDIHKKENKSPRMLVYIREDYYISDY